MDKSIIIHLCKKKGITIAELEKTLGMSNGSLRKDGDIKSERLAAIAEYFNVSMEYLLGKKVIQINNYMLLPNNVSDDIDSFMESMSPVQVEIYEELAKMDENKMEALLTIIKTLNNT